MSTTSIEWTDKTWNPVRGCDKVSPGCKHCYAETFAERWRGVPGHPYEQGFDLRLVPEKLAEPLRWKKPQRVFVNSMSDLFHEDVPNEYIAAVFGIMAACPWFTFQVLTKRAERMREWFRWYEGDSGAGATSYAAAMAAVAAVPGGAESSLPWFDIAKRAPWPLPNVWLGVSVEDQQRANERIPLLLDTPAAVRWVSAEPLLGPVHLDAVHSHNALTGEHLQENAYTRDWPHCLDWIVVGGESGSGARPFDPAWARRIIADCQTAEVPVFVKQMGARVHAGALGDWTTKLRRKGGDPSEWPTDLRVRQWPEVRA